MKTNKGDFGENFTMHFENISKTWMSTGDYIGPGSYEVKFYVHHPDDTFTNITRTFKVEGAPIVELHWVFVGVGCGAATGVAGTITFYLARAGKLDFLKRLFGGGGS